MARGLAGLRTVAETAPLLGMLSTVWSMAKWSRMGCALNFGDAADGPAETFVPMALGLAVGIVASLGYRFLTAWKAGLDAEMRIAVCSLRRHVFVPRPGNIGACETMAQIARNFPPDGHP